MKAVMRELAQARRHYSKLPARAKNSPAHRPVPHVIHTARQGAQQS